MSKTEVTREIVKDLKMQNDGSTVIIESVPFASNTINYSNDDSVKRLATSAVHTADGLYDLIIKNCDIDNAEFSEGSHLEMYLSLAALACEIYMKSIIYNEGLHSNKQIKKHKLDILFNDLPYKHQATILSNIKDLGNNIGSIKSLFETLRYDFELISFSGEYLLVFDLMKELKTICHTYPKQQFGTIRSANGAVYLDKT